MLPVFADCRLILWLNVPRVSHGRWGAGVEISRHGAGFAWSPVKLPCRKALLLVPEAFTDHAAPAHHVSVAWRPLAAGPAVCCAAVNGSKGMRRLHFPRDGIGAAAP